MGAEQDASSATGRRWPAEWAPQTAVQLTWPHAETDWAPRLAWVEPVFAAIGAEVLRRQSLLVVAKDADVSVRASAAIAQACRQRGVPDDSLQRLVIALAPSDDTWARDHAALTVLVDGEPLLLDFRFNGWGGKFPAERDDAITRRLVEQRVLRAPRENVDLVLEGGSIESDGLGTVLTTEHCLCTPTRNPDLDRDAIEVQLKSRFGADRVLWLHSGVLDGDDTDGHVDTLVRFIAPDAIAHVVADEPHPAAKMLAALRDELSALRDRKGQPYRRVELPLPAPMFDEDGHPLPATHANFLFINGAVLLPVYGDAQADAMAIERLGAALPDHEIVPIDCREIVRQGGSLHCLTMQFPTPLQVVEPAQTMV
ncbi:MAG: agmatine deiminase family protein [Thioalkalivibrionaceae bacterium]